MRRIGFTVLAFIGLVLAITASQFRADIAVEALSVKYANAASRFLALPGMRVHYRDEGEGPKLVLLHGTASSLHTWEGWTQELQQDFRVVRMDLPGFGLTGPNATHDYSIPQYVNFLNAFADSLGLVNFHLAGNSLGGEIAWHFALAHPERVQRLVLLDAAGYPITRQPFAFNLARNAFTRSSVRWITPRFLVKKSLLDVYADDSKVTEELVQRYLDFTCRAGNRAAFIARANAEWGNDYARIKQVTMPTLIQWGAQDAWVPVTDAHRFDEDLPNSDLIIYENAGHIPMEEIPTRTARDAKEFLLRERTSLSLK